MRSRPMVCIIFRVSDSPLGAFPRRAVVSYAVLTPLANPMPRTIGPRPIDLHVGSRVRMRRLMLKMSQKKLGDALGITFQQIQKYEKGANRIGASRLQHISEVLQVP